MIPDSWRAQLQQLFISKEDLAGAFSSKPQLSEAYSPQKTYHRVQRTLEVYWTAMNRTPVDVTGALAALEGVRGLICSFLDIVKASPDDTAVTQQARSPGARFAVAAPLSTQAWMGTSVQRFTLNNLLMAVLAEINSLGAQCERQFIDRKLLAQGNTGSVYLVRERSLDVSTHTYVWKPDTAWDELKKKNILAVDLSGIRFAGARLCARAAAATLIDQTLGTNVLATAVIGLFEKQIGSVYEFVDGDTVEELYKQERLNEIYNFYVDCVRDLCHIEVIDYLTGQLDRNPGNIKRTQGGRRARAIDHDMCLGSKNDQSFATMLPFCKARLFIMNPTKLYLDRELVLNLAMLEAEPFRATLGSLLRQKEIDVFLERVRNARTQVHEMTDWSSVVRDVLLAGEKGQRDSVFHYFKEAQSSMARVQPGDGAKCSVC